MRNIFYDQNKLEDTSSITLGKLPIRQLKQLKKKDYYKSRHILNYRAIKEPQTNCLDLNSNNDQFELNIIMNFIQNQKPLKCDTQNSFMHHHKENNFDVQMFHKEIPKNNETSIKNLENNIENKLNFNLNLENQHSQCQVEKSKLREFYEELVNSLQKEVLQLKQYENQIEQYQQRNLNILKENRELSMQVQIQQQINRQDKSKDVMKSLNDKIENLKNQNFMLKEKLEYQQEICQNLNQKMQKQKTIEGSKTQLNMSNIEVLQLKERLKNLEFEKKQYKEELEDRLNSLQHQLSKLEFSKENSFSRDISNNIKNQYNNQSNQILYYPEIQQIPRRVLVSRDAIQNICLNSVQPANCNCYLQQQIQCQCRHNSIQQKILDNRCLQHENVKNIQSQIVRDERPQFRCQCKNLQKQQEKENMVNQYYSNIQQQNNNIEKKFYSQSQYFENISRTQPRRNFKRDNKQQTQNVKRIFQTPEKVKLGDFKKQILQQNINIQSKADQYLNDQQNVQITQNQNIFSKMKINLQKQLIQIRYICNKAIKIIILFEISTIIQQF